eukprot:TRINITY_DN14619_c0_g1_i1.p2 TRINITY_DN14619_c0_g1~~TRINITY_DN14619_c0_g1_i1.p2  ORF type:complete len:105 (-),score=28.34 TRINITY_DN14619_c0_g1_i1:79-393(-)
MLLLLRIRRKEILRDVAASLRERQECLIAVMEERTEAHASGLCKQLQHNLSKRCRGRNKSAGASLLKRTGTKVVQMLARNAGLKKWELRQHLSLIHISEPTRPY